MDKYVGLVALALGIGAGCQAPTDVGVQVSSATTESQESDGVTESVAIEPAIPAKIALTLANYEELQAKIRSLAGKIVVVDVWSTSCIPCMREFPHLVELSKKYSEQVACVSMNVDYIGIKSKSPESYLPKIEEFLSKQNATISNFAASEPDEELREKLGVSSIPAILIYAPNALEPEVLTDANSGEDGLSYEADVIPKIEALIAAGK